MELVVPQIFSEIFLQLDDVVEHNVLLALEENLTESFVCFSEIFLAGLDGTGINSDLILLLLSSRAFLTEVSDFDRELFFGHLSFWIFLESLAKFSRWDLEDQHEEEELGE